jgi:hypothetical protein
MHSDFHLLAFYGGPDQVMTVTSGVASIIGFLLIFWNKLVAGFFKLFGGSAKQAASARQEDATNRSS